MKFKLNSLLPVFISLRQSLNNILLEYAARWVCKNIRPCLDHCYVTREVHVVKKDCKLLESALALESAQRLTAGNSGWQLEALGDSQWRWFEKFLYLFYFVNTFKFKREFYIPNLFRLIYYYNNCIKIN